MINRSFSTSAVRCATKTSSRWGRDNQANYFLAFRLDNQLVQQRLDHFDNHVQNAYPKWRKYLIRPAQAHVTICAMHLKDSKQISAAAELLISSKDLVLKYLGSEPPSVHIKGVGAFDSGRVIQADVLDVSSELMALIRELRLRFWSNGFSEPRNKPPPVVPFFANNSIPEGSEMTVTEGRVGSWTPHATLMKMRGADIMRLKRQAKASLKSALKNQNSKPKKIVTAELEVAEKPQQLTLNDFFGIPKAVHEPFQGKFIIDQL
ncbi:hypothetical protein H4R99_003144 [Coemansia sp. RSA 1722]|nr:hypothetical protein H4R99_003144 [Coemansia sp. RSA 1722]